MVENFVDRSLKDNYINESEDITDIKQKKIPEMKESKFDDSELPPIEIGGFLLNRSYNIVFVMHAVVNRLSPAFRRFGYIG